MTNEKDCDVPYILLISPPMERILSIRYNFINPNPRPYGSYGALHVATYLNKNGFETGVYNANLKRNKVRETEKQVWDGIEKDIFFLINSKRPKIVGISILSPQFEFAIRIAKFIKGINEDIVIMVGGWHPTLMPEETIKVPFFDIVVRGEGEITALEVIKTIQNGGNLRAVEGVTYIDKEEIVHTPERPVVKNLDELPFPDRDLLLFKEYYPKSEIGAISTSRGCPHKCTFCSSQRFWKGFRSRSQSNIIDEIKFLQKNYKINDFWFAGDTFLTNRKNVVKLCEEINENKLNILWGCLGRVDEIDEELIKIMKSAGLYNISVGAESGSQKILDIYKKGTTVDQIENTIKLLKKNGIFVDTYWILGAIEETEETLNETICLIKRAKPHKVEFCFYTPFIGTEEYNKAKEQDRLLTNDWFRYNLTDYDLVKRKHIDNERLFRKYKEDFQRFEIQTRSSFFRFLLKHPILLIRKIKFMS